MSTQGSLRSGQLIDCAHGVWDFALVTASGGGFGIGSVNAAAAGDTASTVANYTAGVPNIPLNIPAGSTILSVDVVQEAVIAQAGVGTVQVSCGATTLSSAAVGNTLGGFGAGYGWPAFIEGVAGGIGAGFPGGQTSFVAAAGAITLTVAGTAVTAGRLHVYVTYIQARI